MHVYETKIGHDPRMDPTHALYWIQTQPTAPVAKSGLTPHQATMLRQSLVDTRARISASDVATKQRIDARIAEVDRYMATKRSRPAQQRAPSLALLRCKMRLFLEADMLDTGDAGKCRNLQGRARN